LLLIGIVIGAAAVSLYLLMLLASLLSA